jgi:hypothetical protein
MLVWQAAGGVAWQMWEGKAMLHDASGVVCVCVCVCVVLSEEWIFVFSDWDLIAVSFRLETCGCCVSQNSEFLRMKYCSVTFSSFPTACWCLFGTRAKERELVGKAPLRDVSTDFFLQNCSLVWRLSACSGTSSSLLLEKYCCSVNQNSEFWRVKLFFSDSNLKFLLKRRAETLNVRQNSLFWFTQRPNVSRRKEENIFFRDRKPMIVPFPTTYNKQDSGACRAVSKRIPTRCRKGRKRKRRQLDYPDSRGRHTPVTGRRRSYRYEFAFVMWQNFRRGKIH